MTRRWLLSGLAVSVLSAGLGATILARPVPRLLWNASASAPLGLYAIQPGASPGVGDWAVAWLPGPARRLAAERHYLPANVPLVKRVAAAAGQRICAQGDQISIDGVPVARRHARDRAGRPLPAWLGCRTLGAEQLFLLGSAPDSFDGRYFGPLDRAAVLGRAVPQWTW